MSVTEAPMAEQQHTDPTNSLDLLTPRELEVLELIARGWSNSAIDRALCIAPKTTERHISRIYQKLELPDTPGAHRRVQAVLRWRELSAELSG